MIVLVVDEASRARKGIAHDVRDALEALDVQVHELFSTVEIADQDLAADDQLLVVGGDPIVREAAAAILSREAGQRPSLGIIGSEQNDFVRTFGLDRGPFVAIQHALSDTLMPIDAMFVEVDGGATTTVNAVEVGWGAMLRLRCGDKAVRLRHRIAAANELDGEATVKVVLDHTSFGEPLSRVIVANGQFLGQEGRVSPRALPDDGRFNVQSWGVFGDELVRGLPGIHVGEHLGHPRIREHQSASVTIEADVPMPVAADGVVIGTTPVTILVDHHALRLHI